MAVVDRQFMTDGTGQAIAEGLNAVAEAIGGGGGSSLPAVTSEDNGDVLTVVNGEWNKATPSGGSAEPLYVNVVLDENGYSEADKTFSEIHTAIQANKQVFVNWSNPNDTQGFTIKEANHIPLNNIMHDLEGSILHFICIFPGDSDVSFLKVSFYEENDIVVTEEHWCNWDN